MILLDASQIRAWDAYTIKNEPISSFDLMERAALACLKWLSENRYLQKSFSIFCGKGNNGGDGLALARLLSLKGSSVTVYILEFGKLGTADFQRNLQLLHETAADIHFISEPVRLPLIEKDEILIDALLGTGLNKPLEGLWQSTVQHLNESGNEIISIDMPTGMYADESSIDKCFIKASHTLSFQCYKTAYLVAENETGMGQVHILDIGLDHRFLSTLEKNYQLLSFSYLKPYFKKRHLFSHKGKHGHAALLVGSKGMMGAAILAAKACLRSGAGKLTCYIPAEGMPVLHTGIPEAMCSSDNFVEGDEKIDRLSSYDTFGIGPGLGNTEESKNRLLLVLKYQSKPVVLDADALNLLSGNPDLWKLIPPNSILTPHVKELERLFGKVGNDYERIDLVIKKAKEYQVVVVFKGHYTLIADSSGKYIFNCTGNPGLAKGGTGDVLTGIITAFLSQGYPPFEAACFGVHLHGMAADKAIETMAQESLLASDVIDNIGQCITAYY